MTVFRNRDGKSVLIRIVNAIQENKVFLGEIDGLIGDGDHGANMNKGFTSFEKRYADQEYSFTEGLGSLAMVLMNEVGGSMGPIYGTLLSGMSEAGEALEEISLKEFGEMLNAGLEGLYDIVDARVGDKTLVDTLAPAAEAVNKAAEDGLDFSQGLALMKKAAASGRDSTKDLVAKYGRSSRLGERSRGVLDAGAASCCLILSAMADGISEILK